jgi:major intracellular serine protease
MKVRVTRLLNIRFGAPRLNAPIKGVLNPGFEVEVVGLVDGDSFQGNFKWYKGLNDNYYWSGAVTTIDISFPPSTQPTFPPATFTNDKFDWGFRKIGISKIWDTIKGKGKNVKVAILDTGIDFNHPDLPEYITLGNANFICKNFLNNTINVQDADGHGTHCAGIISGQGKQIWGIAPECKLMIGKIMERRSGKGGKFEFLVNGIKWAIENGAEIISLSLSTPLDSNDLHNIIKDAHSNHGVSIICAIGNQGEFSNDIFPACYSECVAVGSINENSLKDEFSNLSKELDLLAPGVNIKSTGLNGGYLSLSGTSMATAFVSGVFALIKSFGKSQSLNNTDYNTLIINSADDYGAIVGFDTESGHGIINPFNVLSKLITV